MTVAHKYILLRSEKLSTTRCPTECVFAWMMLLLNLFKMLPRVKFMNNITGADPGFFPRGGQVGQSARQTPQAFLGKVRRGVWGSSPQKK